MRPRDAETAWTPVIHKVFPAVSRAAAVAFLLLSGTRTGLFLGEEAAVFLRAADWFVKLLQVMEPMNG